MPPAIKPTLRTLARVNRGLARGLTAHLLFVAIDHGHYDAGMCRHCARDLGLRSADVTHLTQDFTAQEREEMRASGARALYAGSPQFVAVPTGYRAAADPF